MSLPGHMEVRTGTLGARSPGHIHVNMLVMLSFLPVLSLSFPNHSSMRALKFTSTDTQRDRPNNIEILVQKPALNCRKVPCT